MEKTFVEEVTAIAGNIHWNLMYRIPKAVRKFNKTCTFLKRTTYKNISIIREESGRELLILKIDYNKRRKSLNEIMAMYDVVYATIHYCCRKFGIKYEFKNIKNLDDPKVPSTVRDFLVYGTNPEEQIVSDPPMIINEFYFYTYL